MVGAKDRYCHKCGSAQPIEAAEPSGSRPDFAHGMSSHTASLLCYIPWIGWIAAIVVLASARFRREHQVRFHAFQGLYLFVAWLLIEWVLMPLIPIDGGVGFFFPRLIAHALQLLIFVAWIFMMIKVSRDQTYRLPLVGEMAERSVSEQRT